MRRISYAEFGTEFLTAVVTSERIADTVGVLAGERVEIGPLSAGPGGVGRVKARGLIGRATLAADRSAEPFRFRATLPVELELRVDVAGAHDYRCDLTIALDLTLCTTEPLALLIEVGRIEPDDVTVDLAPSGVRARVLQVVGNVDAEIRRHVADVVNQRLDDETDDGAHVIRLLPLVDRAWAGGLD